MILCCKRIEIEEEIQSSQQFNQFYQQNNAFNPLLNSTSISNGNSRGSELRGRGLEFDDDNNDAFSLHSTRAATTTTTTNRGGRSSGDELKGWTWTLFYSYLASFKSNEGKIRLEDSTNDDDDEALFDAEEGREAQLERLYGGGGSQGNDYDRTIDLTLGLNDSRATGENDARELSQFNYYQDHHHQYDYGSNTSIISSSSRQPSNYNNDFLSTNPSNFVDDATAELDRREARRLRKEHRAIKRRAKELGLTLEEFNNGQQSKLADHAVGLRHHSSAAHLLLPKTSFSRSSKASSRTSNTSSQSNQEEQNDFVHISRSISSDLNNATANNGAAEVELEEVEDDEEEEELFGRKKQPTTFLRSAMAAPLPSSHGDGSSHRSTSSNPRPLLTSRPSSSNRSSTSPSSSSQQPSHPSSSQHSSSNNNHRQQPNRRNSHQSHSSISTTISAGSNTGSAYHNQRRKEAYAAAAAEAALVEDPYSHIGQLN